MQARQTLSELDISKGASQAGDSAPSGPDEGGAAGDEVPLLYLSYHNSNGEFPSRLKKTAFSLAENIRWMVERRGIERIGFMTLTFKENLVDNAKASKRFNSFATGFLRQHFGDYVCCVERQSRGALHYHLIVDCLQDIRTGCDWDGIGAGCYKSANRQLRSLWGALRVACAKYGFGRSELLPVKSTAEGVARYVGKYVRMDWECRTTRDRYQRKVRYGMEVRPFSANFQWYTDASAQWREGCRRLALLIGTIDFKGHLGTKWAWIWRKTIAQLCVFNESELAEMVSLLDGQDIKTRISKLMGGLSAYEFSL